MAAPQQVLDALDRLDAANAAAQQGHHDLDAANQAVADATTHQQQLQQQAGTDDAAVQQARMDLEHAIDAWLNPPAPPPPPPAAAGARAPAPTQANSAQRPGTVARPPAPRR